MFQLQLRYLVFLETLLESIDQVFTIDAVLGNLLQSLVKQGIVLLVDQVLEYFLVGLQIYL